MKIRYFLGTLLLPLQLVLLVLGIVACFILGLLSTGARRLGNWIVSDGGVFFKGYELSKVWWEMLVEGTREFALRDGFDFDADDKRKAQAKKEEDEAWERAYQERRKKEENERALKEMQAEAEAAAADYRSAPACDGCHRPYNGSAT